MSPKLQQDNNAVSPVVGVSLMVALTVALGVGAYAALGGESPDVSQVEAAVHVDSPKSGNYTLTLLRGIDAPFTDYSVSVDGTTCDAAEVTAGGDASWAVGEVIFLDENVSGSCQDELATGATHVITVAINGQVVLTRDNIVLAA